MIQRAGGLLGAIAIAAAAYGSHGLPSRLGKMSDDPAEIQRYKDIWTSASRMHLAHSIVLLAAPLLRRPLLVGGLLLAGTLVFSGSCYLAAFAADRSLSRPAPLGGFMLIAGWLCIALL